MENYAEQLKTEEAYLRKALAIICAELAKTDQEFSSHRSELIALRKDMLENTAPFSSDVDKLIDIYQYLSEVKIQTSVYANISQYSKRYKTLIESPYFGRFDFQEDGFDQQEQIYIGLANVMDQDTRDVYVYDWRAPISSIFYRYELGRADYQTPSGPAGGEVFLKRQYKIKDSKLLYFFDCNVRITDEILQDVLARNASPKMKSIVESIQKEQDIIIRDTESRLLLVQGPAGSGKTSIALHRIAFLLYEGLNANLRSSNMMIISPNDVFSQYISSVLPDLGEENVLQTTFDDLVAAHLGGSQPLERREDYLENMIDAADHGYSQFERRRALFKGSDAFRRILDQWVDYYGRHLIPFEDASFAGEILETRQQLKNRFLHNEIGIPMAKQLTKIENLLLPLTHPYKKARLQRLKSIVSHSEGRDFEIKQFSRLLAIRESQAFRRRIRKFTRVDYRQIYNRLFSEDRFLAAVSANPQKIVGKDLSLPAEFDGFLSSTADYLQQGKIGYEDYAPLLYLKLKIEGTENVSEIRHVVIDEAQDYTPLQYYVFKQLYGGADFTVLGDIAQNIMEERDLGLYEDIARILDKEKTLQLFLRKSYRSTAEIQSFAQRLLVSGGDAEAFARHGQPPEVLAGPDASCLFATIREKMKAYLAEGYETVAVICKTQRQAAEVYAALSGFPDLKLVTPSDRDFKKGPLVISAVMAKGLEFDAVIVYNVNEENYRQRMDKGLLYVACTRALHRLMLCYCGEISSYLS